MSTFDPQRRRLSNLLDEIERGEIQLPEFQRPYKWARKQKNHLLTSVQKNYPVGTLLFLEMGAGSAGTKFKHTPLHGVSELKTKDSIPSDLVLDGQQRLTTLFHAFRKETPKWTCLDVEALFRNHKENPEAEVDLEDFVRMQRYDNSPENVLHNKHLLPLYLSMPNDEERSLVQILSSYSRSLESQERFEMAEFVINYLPRQLEVFSNYELPVVRLSKELSITAITSIFTELNNNGLRLTSFDLCVARFFPSGLNLKQLFDDSTQKSDNYRWLDPDGTVTLQTIALLQTANSGIAVNSKKNKLVESLSADWVRDDWENAALAISGFGEFLKKAGVTSSKTLPYDAVTPALAVGSAQLLAAGEKEATIVSKLRAFILSTGFTRRYTEGTDAKRETDLVDFVDFVKLDRRPAFLENLLNTEELIPQTLAGARHKSFLALLNGENARDILSNEDIGLGFPHKTDAELHHIFPEAHLRNTLPKLGSKKRSWDVSLNLMLLSGPTNRLVGDKTPSAYIDLVVKRLMAAGISEAGAQKRVKDAFAAQLVDEVAWKCLLNDDFDGFLIARAKNLSQKLEELGVRATFMVGAFGDTNTEDEEDSE